MTYYGRMAFRLFGIAMLLILAMYACSTFDYQTKIKYVDDTGRIVQLLERMKPTPSVTINTLCSYGPNARTARRTYLSVTLNGETRDTNAATVDELELWLVTNYGGYFVAIEGE